MASSPPPTDESWFFRFYRQRLSNLRQLDTVTAVPVSGFPGSFLPDRFILAVAGLESLAGHWSRFYKGKKCSGGERLALFLLEHGDAEIFGRCSIPSLWSRAARDKNADSIVRALSQSRWTRSRRGTLRRWQEDPLFQEVASDPAIRKSGIDTDWIRLSRYGEILYSEFRCSWVHEFDGPMTEAIFQVADDEPRYQTWAKIPSSDKSSHELVFPLAFLVRTYAAVLDSFSAKCARDGKAYLTRAEEIASRKLLSAIQKQLRGTTERAYTFDPATDGLLYVPQAVGEAIKCARDAGYVVSVPDAKGGFTVIRPRRQPRP